MKKAKETKMWKKNEKIERKLKLNYAEQTKAQKWKNENKIYF